jgi:hypothetical protein
MGLFSWRTLDTDRSIPCVGANRDVFTVYLLDNKGNKWEENAYDGYGEFGGKDYHELLAEMNGLESDRDAGIDLAFKYNIKGGGEWYDASTNTKVKILWPNLVENSKWLWINKENESCEYQGYFYDGCEECEENSRWYDYCPECGNEL